MNDENQQPVVASSRRLTDCENLFYTNSIEDVRAYLRKIEASNVLTTTTQCSTDLSSDDTHWDVFRTRVVQWLQALERGRRATGQMRGEDGQREGDAKQLRQNFQTEVAQIRDAVRALQDTVVFEETAPSTLLAAKTASEDLCQEICKVNDGISTTVTDDDLSASKGTLEILRGLYQDTRETLRTNLIRAANDPFVTGQILIGKIVEASSKLGGDDWHDFCLSVLQGRAQLMRMLFDPTNSSTLREYLAESGDCDGIRGRAERINRKREALKTVLEPCRTRFCRSELVCMEDELHKLRDIPSTPPTKPKSSTLDDACIVMNALLLSVTANCEVTDSDEFRKSSRLSDFQSQWKHQFAYSDHTYIADCIAKQTLNLLPPDQTVAQIANMIYIATALRHRSSKKSDEEYDTCTPESLCAAILDSQFPLTNICLLRQCSTTHRRPLKFPSDKLTKSVVGNFFRLYLIRRFSTELESKQKRRTDRYDLESSKCKIFLEKYAEILKEFETSKFDVFENDRELVVSVVVESSEKHLSSLDADMASRILQVGSRGRNEFGVEGTTDADTTTEVLLMSALILFLSGETPLQQLDAYRFLELVFQAQVKNDGVVKILQDLYRNRLGKGDHITNCLCSRQALLKRACSLLGLSGFVIHDSSSDLTFWDANVTQHADLLLVPQTTAVPVSLSEATRRLCSVAQTKLISSVAELLRVKITALPSFWTQTVRQAVVTIAGDKQTILSSSRRSDPSFLKAIYFDLQFLGSYVASVTEEALPSSIVHLSLIADNVYSGDPAGLAAFIRLCDESVENYARRSLVTLMGLMHEGAVKQILGRGDFKLVETETAEEGSQTAVEERAGPKVYYYPLLPVKRQLTKRVEVQTERETNRSSVTESASVFLGSFLSNIMNTTTGGITESKPTSTPSYAMSFFDTTKLNFPFSFEKITNEQSEHYSSIGVGWSTLAEKIRTAAAAGGTAPPPN